VKRFLLCLGLSVAACGAAACGGTSEEVGSGGAPPPGSGGGGMGGSPPSVGGQGGDGPSFIEQACPEGTYAVALDEDGMLACEAIDAGALAAPVNDACAVYSGWNDGCNGCLGPPSKWGRAGDALCEIGAGEDNSCVEPVLAGAAVPMFGLNTNGDVDGNDTFHFGLHCPAVGETPTPGPCGPGEYVVSATPEGTTQCLPAGKLAVNYVRDECGLYAGWRDGCDGCVDPPSKWGHTHGTSCEIGAGAEMTCAAQFLAGDWVVQIGVNADGDVDGNDKFYLGLECAAPADAGGPASGRCPFGQLVVGLHADNTLECASPAAVMAATLRESCFTYFGYTDGCEGCLADPAKWGRASSVACEPGAGGDSGCVSANLGGADVALVGMNTDGDVDGNDMFYVGFRCE
jgi:hypothetical protein